MNTYSLIRWAANNTRLLQVTLVVLLAASFPACNDAPNPYVFDVEAQKKLDDLVIHKYFLDNNVDTTQVHKTASGLYYMELTAGTGAAIASGDLVEVGYLGKFTNGVKFDSSYDRANNFIFTVGAQQVIKGWDEGLQLMKVGGETRFYIPSHLAYGYRGSGSVPPNSVLIFDIKVFRKK